MNATDYQLVIVGGGPAGLTAGLYAARSRLTAVLLEKMAVGGQVLLTHWVDNFPGFPDGVAGYDLIDRMAAQAARFGLETRTATVESLDLAGPVKRIRLAGEGEITARAVILATGARPNTLGVPGEKELTGKGVSYCATCDGPFYRDQEVAVVGGGNTAVQEAIYLTRFCKKVMVVHRRDELRATRILQEEAFANDKIEFVWNSVAVRIEGDGAVQGLVVRNRQGEESRLAVEGVFVLIGTIPNSEMLPDDQLELDEYGFVMTDAEMRTNLPGVLAAGDIRCKSVRQVVNAVGEGAVAEQKAEEYLHHQAG